MSNSLWTLKQSYGPIIAVVSVLFAGFPAFYITTPQVKAAESSGFTPLIIEKISVSRQLSLLRAICEPGKISMHNGVPICNTCPSFTTGDQASRLSVSNAIEGNFTRLGTKQVLLDTIGCEPATSNAGGSVLLEPGESGWTRVLYLPGFRSNECIRFRTMQQTASLACNMSSIEGGVQHGKLEWLNLRDAKPVQIHLLDWYDNSQSNPRQLVSIFPHRFMKSDFNSDGRVDLQVSLRMRDETVPAKYPGYIDAMVAGHRFKKAESLRLVYLFDGSTLVLSPHSEPVKKDVDTVLKRIHDQ